MPVVLRIGPYTFFFNMDDAVCKFWLLEMKLAKNEGYRPSEIRKVGTLIRENRELLLEAWYANFPY